MSGSAPKLLRIAVHEPDWIPELMALCAGYERTEWRAEALADQVFEWLPSFALPWTEQQRAIGDGSAVRLLRKAAEIVYQTPKYQQRGEFGELILHGILQQEFGTQAAITKFWFKDAANDTVKGFDVIHVTDSLGEAALHLWLGEAKFYSDLDSAVGAALGELEDHLTHDYLRTEFMLLSNKIDPHAPFARRLAELLDDNTSLDQVFSRLHVPVLLTFDSTSLERHSDHTDEYFDELRSEIESAWRRFADRVEEVAPADVVVHLILVPLFTKQILLDLLDEKLRSWQNI